MFNGLQGIPGSGKSYEACVFHVLPAIRSGRKVITNLPVNIEQLKVLCPDNWHLLEVRTQASPVRGKWDASNVALNPAFQLFEDGRVEKPHSMVPFSTVWCFWTDWKREDGIGPLYIIDECQIPFPKKGGAPRAIQEWSQLHRHYNADVLLLSQSFRQVDDVLCGLLANLIICRKADILGKSDAYIRKVKAGYRGDVIQSETRKYEKQFFSLYKSHTQSSSSAEASVQDVSPKLKKLKLFTRVFWVVAIAFAAWAWWPKDKPKPKPAQKPAVQHQVAPQNQVQQPAQTQALSIEPATPATSQKQEPEPTEETFGVLDGKSVHLLGSMGMGGKTKVVFEVSDNGRRLFQIDLQALESSGYQVKMLDTCLARVRSPAGKFRSVICDAPITPQYDNKQPLVIDSRTGESSWDKSGDHPYRSAASSGPRYAATPEALGWEERNQLRNAEVSSSSITSRLRPNYPGR